MFFMREPSFGCVAPCRLYIEEIEVLMKEFKESVSIAMAYVGVIVGAGLSSGQDILQYFLSFGKQGIWGILLFCVLNVVFGKIIVTLGSYFRSNSHSEVLGAIASPVTNRIIDWTLIAAGFIIGFVMLAGAGSNLNQQFGIPSWAGALFCALLIIAVTFLDFDKITKVLGIFTPVVILFIVLITAYSILTKPLDIAALSSETAGIPSPLPNIWLSALNYFSLCAMTGVSMGFVLGGSIVRIGTAEKGGALGGTMVGLIITGAYISMFLNIGMVKGAEMPILEIVNAISPALGLVYALVIFFLIFNTAFSLYYGLACRFGGGNSVRVRTYLILFVAAGYGCSFGGFRSLISLTYPFLGYMGFVLLAVLASAWIRGRDRISAEKDCRRNMIRLARREYADVPYTRKDREQFDRLGKQSVIPAEEIKRDIREYVRTAGTAGL
jgi:uncharacterized membrane protein YkvI